MNSMTSHSNLKLTLGHHRDDDKMRCVCLSILNVDLLIHRTCK